MPPRMDFGDGPPPHLLMTIHVINTITHILLGASAFSAIFFANIFVASSTLTQHIYLCVIGYVILMAEAVLSLNPHTGWAKAFRYEDRRIIHSVLQFAGAALVISGSIVRMNSLTNNFQTPHGILGLIAMLLTFLSLIAGGLNFFFSTMNKNPVLFKTIHSCLGCSTLIFAFVCLCLGFNGYFRTTLGDTNANLSIVVTVLALLGTLITPFINTVKRLV